MFLSIGMLKLNYFLADIFILSAEKQPIKLSWRKIECLPDLTFEDSDGHLFAVDFKSSYYTSESVNGLTLGSYWGYFRNRDKKNEYGLSI